MGAVPAAVYDLVCPQPGGAEQRLGRSFQDQAGPAYTGRFVAEQLHLRTALCPEQSPEFSVRQIRPYLQMPLPQRRVTLWSTTNWTSLNMGGVQSPGAAVHTSMDSVLRPLLLAVAYANLPSLRRLPENGIPDCAG